VVKLIDDISLYNLLEILEVYNKTRRRKITCIGRMSANGDMQFIGVPMNIAALAVVTMDGMGHFKMKDLG
jgi:hypothetical protein